MKLQIGTEWVTVQPSFCKKKEKKEKKNYWKESNANLCFPYCNLSRDNK